MIKEFINRAVKEVVNTTKGIVYHTPRNKLTEEEIETVKKNGVIHFTYYDKAKSIEKTELRPNEKKALFKKERDLVWVFLNEEKNFERNLKTVHSKGDRSAYDAYVIIKNLSDEQIKSLKIRKETDFAVSHKGSLKTNSMISYKISKEK